MTTPARPDLDAIKRREAEMDGHKIGNPAEWCRTCALVAWVEHLEEALYVLARLDRDHVAAWIRDHPAPR